MSHDDDFHVEPVRGLPELPPEGERILWQGAPEVWPLARQSLAADWVAGYFVLLALWRGGVVMAAEGPMAGLVAASWLVAIGAVVVGLLLLMAWIMARGTCYTLTTQRVAMRIGAALTVTLNLPYKWIGSADIAVSRDGTGTIALDLRGPTKLSYLVLWPHVRPWHMGRPKPALRAIRDPQAVADLLAHAAAARVTPIETMAPVRTAGAARPIAAE